MYGAVLCVSMSTVNRCPNTSATVEDRRTLMKIAITFLIHVVNPITRERRKAKKYANTTASWNATLVHVLLAIRVWSISSVIAAKKGSKSTVEINRATSNVARNARTFWIVRNTAANKTVILEIAKIVRSKWLILVSVGNQKRLGNVEMKNSHVIRNVIDYWTVGTIDARKTVTKENVDHVYFSLNTHWSVHVGRIRLISCWSIKENHA